MPEVSINWLMVFLSGVAFMALGFVWYGPMLFGKAWMKLSGYTSESLKKEQANMGKTYGISFLLSLLTAYILSHVIVFSLNFYGYPKLTTGLISAFWMWLGFVMPVQMTGWLFDKKPFNLLLINTGYQLVGMLIMGVILTW